jgi:dihydroorotase
MNAGFQSTVLGLPGIDALAEEAMLWRDIELVKKLGANGTRYHAQHISTAGSVKLIREAQKASLPVTCEVTPHHLLLSEECCAHYDTNYKVSPPLRSRADIEALKEAIAEGLIDAMVTDHAPHLQSEKELEFLAAPFGIASLECALGLYVRALIEPGILDWPDLIKLMTYVRALIEPGILDWPDLIKLMTVGPAGIIGVDKGTLSKGKQADVTIIDPDAEYTIDVNKFRSKSRNCPYHGWTVKGKVEKTIVGGEVRFSANSE